MRKLFLLTTVACFASIPIAQAGSVDAPYVHVDWWGGRLHVCAPFVNLYTNLPGCCGARCECDDPCAPDRTPPAPPMSADERARRQLAASGSELYDSLDRFRTSELWQHYLAVAPGETLSPNKLRRANAATLTDLKATLTNFDSTVEDDQYHMISSLPAFKQARAQLAEYVAQHENFQPVSVIPPVAGPTAQLTSVTPAPTPTRHWSPASIQPRDGLPGMARDIARPAPEELPSPR